MKEQLIKAARMHAEGELERAKTNILVYMNQSVGIGEHSDIVEQFKKSLIKCLWLMIALRCWIFTLKMILTNSANARKNK